MKRLLLFILLSFNVYSQEAIIGHQYNESIELENENNFKIKVFLHWEN